ncbi:MAG TPA: vitamin K epoxide reductase family protein [Ktedonobacterales bacterium]|nr:vitamin K epoxide reductase family protein [Ktedonobacterales bacterium]
MRSETSSESVNLTPRPPLPQGEGEKDAPPGWSYNPSAWRERRLLIALAALGFCAALYTALYQLSVVPHLWDPFFGAHSSYLVTHSKVSKILPFPDGVLGIPGYLGDLIFGSLGGASRWRTRTWAVLAFAATISGLATVSLLLTITMGVLVHSWCTVCLVSATVSTLIFGLGIGEALPALQYLKRVYGREHTLAAVWRALWGARERPAREPRGEPALS